MAYPGGGDVSKQPPRCQKSDYNFYEQEESVPTAPRKPHKERIRPGIVEMAALSITLPQILPDLIRHPIAEYM